MLYVEPLRDPSPQLPPTVVAGVEMANVKGSGTAGLISTLRPDVSLHMNDRQEKEVVEEVVQCICTHTWHLLAETQTLHGNLRVQH
jgi:hypothetical protein